MCSFCGVENKSDEPMHLFSDEEIDALILAIFAGVINVRNLDVNTYQKIARKLSEGVFEGFGKNISDTVYASEDWAMLKALQNNVFIFSGAKTYQQTREISSLLLNEKIRRWADFKKEAKKIFLDYNENYLRTEYQSAIQQARSASQWMEIEKDKDVVEMLTYHTVGDARVRPTHRELDDITRHVEDKFWDSYMPPNGWNCRCTVLQNNENEKTDLRGFKKPADVPDIFLFNAGKEKIVFSPKHPYFQVAPRDKGWAKRNFGMPIP